MTLLAILLLLFGLWASAWGMWACFNRPRPHDWLGSLIALVGVGALGVAALLFLHPGFFSG
ncbi:MAG: hypothetical protein ABI333_00175 [bacterium]